MKKPEKKLVEQLSRQGNRQRLLGFALTLAASLGTFGFFAIQGIILARLLGPAGRGAFAAAVIFPQALLYVGLLGAPELIAGYAARGLPNVPLRRTAARYGLTAGVVSLVICVFLDLLTIPADMRLMLPLAILCALALPLQQIRLSVQAVDHGQRQFTRYNNVRLMAAAVFPGFLLVAVLLGHFADPRTDSSMKFEANESASGIVIESVPPVEDNVSATAAMQPVPHAVSIACVLFVVSQAAALLLTQLGMTGSWFGTGAIPVRQALHDGRGLIGAWLSTELLERIDVVLVMILLANQEILGYYTTAIPVASLLIILPNTVGLYVFNRGAREEERMNFRDARRLLLVGLAVQVLSALLLAAALPYLLPLIYGEDFAPTVQFAWLLLPAGVFRGLLQAADGYLRARRKPSIGVKARAISLPVLLGISFFGAPWLGTAAIPVGLSIAQGMCFWIVASQVLEDTRQEKSLRA